MADFEQNTVCRCLGISESEIRAAADFAGCETVAEIKDTTEAGTGCTSCHKRILKLLAETRQRDQVPAASPT